MQSERQFRSWGVCRLVGITYRQLDYWARTDLIRPSITEANGSGTQRRFSYEDVVLLAVVRNLTESGVSLQSARRAVTHLRSYGTASDVVLLVSGNDVALARSAAEVTRQLRRGRGAFTVLSLERVREQIDEAIAHQGAEPRLAAVGVPA